MPVVRKLVVMLLKLASTAWTLTRGWPALPPNAALDETTRQRPSLASNFMDEVVSGGTDGIAALAVGRRERQREIQVRAGTALDDRQSAGGQWL